MSRSSRILCSILLYSSANFRSRGHPHGNSSPKWVSQTLDPHRVLAHPVAQGFIVVAPSHEAITSYLTMGMKPVEEDPMELDFLVSGNRLSDVGYARCRNINLGDALQQVLEVRTGRRRSVREPVRAHRSRED